MTSSLTTKLWRSRGEKKKKIRGIKKKKSSIQFKARAVANRPAETGKVKQKKKKKKGRAWGPWDAGWRGHERLSGGMPVWEEVECAPSG